MAIRYDFQSSICHTRFTPNHHHINLCTTPGSLAHSNPFPKNTTHVPTLTTINHSVSPHNLDLSISSPANEPRLGRTCSRHSTHGRMKYRGSTRGAVISDRAVVMSQMSTNDVLVSLTGFLSLPGTVGRDDFPRRAVTLLESTPWLQSARSASQPQKTYIGASAYFMSGWRRIV